MNTFLAELVNVTFKVCTGIFPQHLLKDSKITLVVDFRTGCEGLEWLDHLNCEPVTLISNLADDHLVKPLQASLLEDSQHAVVSEFELVAIRLRELQLRFFLLV